ncbi:MAG: hypothetical protein ACW97P_06165 [Candidatus Hodarchaeales archaeon]|jgi:hypothetical protein
MNDLPKLTTNQKRVIIGLCIYPMSSDSEIASKIGVKRSTFSTIKKQLVKKEPSLIRPINIPNVFSLGAEIISFSYSRFDSKNLGKNQNSIYDGIRKRINQFPNIVKTIFELNQSFSFALSKNFTDIYLAHNSIAGYYYENKLCTPDDLHLFNASIRKNSILKFMDYGDFLLNLWDIDFSLESEKTTLFSSPNKESMQISSIGWEIYMNLIENPDFSIIELAKISRKPRNTIARWVNYFRRKNLYQTRYIPNLSLLGIQIQSFYILAIRGYPQPLVDKILNLIIQILKPTDLFVSSREIFISTISKDYFSHRGIEVSFYEKMKKFQLPYMIQRKVDLSISNMTTTKSLQSSLRTLIAYLRLESKYLIKPNFDKINSNEQLTEGAE